MAIPCGTANESAYSANARCYGQSAVRFFFMENFIMRTSNSTYSQRQYNISMLETVVWCMQLYLVPCIVVVGVSAGVTCFVVFLRTRLRKKFFTHFLVCVCFGSCGFLSVVFLTWMSGQGLNVYSAPGLCQMYAFCNHFFPFLTVWTSVLGAYLILWDSIKPRSLTWMDSAGKAKLIVISMALFGFTIYSYKTWTHYGAHHINHDQLICKVIPENEAMMGIMNILDIVFLTVVPSVLFLVFDIILVGTKLYGRGKVRLQNCSPRHREVLKMVVAHSVCFHLLVTPRGISMLEFIINQRAYDRRPTVEEILSINLFQFFFYAYFAVLAVFPIIISEKFRYYLFSLFGFRLRRTPSYSVRTRQLPLFL
ncbi:uncharacterized protein LOC121369884 [Gigantopelta aegis]|uniref:uncharacterized protein LOC121369884 n=1 Tax=Gigantopelta aegis TaxID=1735272 RepID=UPI001B88D874|nr:uncharacterized protein LOC121369884 [Gigantopelta aegis]